MQAYCRECGEQLKNGTCPLGHEAASGTPRPSPPPHEGSPQTAYSVTSPEPALVGAGAGGGALTVGVSEPQAIHAPKPSTARRLLGSGIEFLAYSVAILILNVVSPLTGGAIGFLAVPLLLLMVGLRDVKSGKFSLGKRVGGMRVVDARTLLPASDTQALKRNSYYLILILLMIFPLVKVAPTAFFKLLLLIDVLMIFASRNGRRLGDHLAGTLVVSEQRSGR